MINKALYKTIKDNFVTDTFYRNSGYNAEKPYFVIKTVDANEDSVKNVFCTEVSGQVLLQIDSVAINTALSEDNLEPIKDYVKGLTSVSDGTNNYIIENNITDGVRSIEDVTLNTWLSFFESTLTWRLI